MQRGLDLLKKIDAGEHICNLLAPDYDLGQFAGKFDFSKIVVAGHSFGATAAIALAGQDQRIKLVLVLSCSEEDVVIL